MEYLEKLVDMSQNVFHVSQICSAAISLDLWWHFNEQKCIFQQHESNYGLLNESAQRSYRKESTEFIRKNSW